MQSQLMDEQTQKKDDSNSWIKVYVRVRPLLRNEIGQEKILSIENDNQTVTLEGSSTNQFSQKFDKAFNENSQQYEIFYEFKQSSYQILQGFNFSIIAYGQTGSGKTYTMFGNDWEYKIHSEIKRTQVRIQKQSTVLEDIAMDKNNAGMIPRSIYHLFNIVDEANKTQNQQYFIYCSFLQIYNEKIYDLLVDQDKPQPLQMHESKLDGVFVEGLSEYAVNHYYDCLVLMKRGERNRFTRQTTMNAKSSRSHTIFKIQIETSKADEMGNFKCSKLKLCDLAGSEKAKKNIDLKKDHMTEMININQSLTTLGKVIQNLYQNQIKQKQLPIPYRESKLTRLLQDSLGGSTQTYFIATVTSSIFNIDETYSTLKFAERAKNITLNVSATKINGNSSELVNKLTKEINYLKGLLNMKRSGINQNDLHFKVIKLQEENDRLRNQTVSIQEVEKLIQENRNMKIEISKLQQTLTVGEKSVIGAQEAFSEDKTQGPQSENNLVQLPHLVIHTANDDFHFPSIETPPFNNVSQRSLQQSYRNLGSNEQSSNFIFNTRSSSQNLLENSNNNNNLLQINETRTYNRTPMRLSRMSEVSSLSKNGLMVIKNLPTNPKTEVTIRSKGKNNQYFTKKGFVEQSEKEFKKEQDLRNERNRVLERLEMLSFMKEENKQKLKEELELYDNKNKDYNSMFMKFEHKERKRLLTYNNKLKIIEKQLILN